MVGVPALSELDGVELIAHALAQVRDRFHDVSDQLAGAVGSLRFVGCYALL
ncbi:hypothetical protein [Streptomyces sp. NPDC006285]|uniref:hypothetical protein n=1 Tax=Streptomyces sp. NPDC006285 TaxID=3364742 RepID=UPI00368EE7C9